MGVFFSPEMLSKGVLEQEDLVFWLKFLYDMIYGGGARETLDFLHQSPGILIRVDRPKTYARG